MDETSVCKIKEQILRDGRRDIFCVLDSVCVDVSTKIKKNIS